MTLSPTSLEGQILSLPVKPAEPVTGFSDRSGSLVILVARGSADAWYMPSEPDVPEAPTVTARGSHVGAEPSDGAAFSCCPERDLAQHAPSRCWSDSGAPEGRSGVFKEGALCGPAQPRSLNANTQRQGAMAFWISTFWVQNVPFDPNRKLP